jgi:hypothetical protein
MFLVVLVLGLVLGLIRGGRMINLLDLPIRFTWLPLVGFGLQVFLVMFPPAGWEGVLTLAPVVVGLSYLTLLAFLLINRLIPGAKLLLIGALLNFAVMLANGGRMPVTAESLQRSGHGDRVVAFQDVLLVRGSKDVVLDQGETKLWFLSDIFGIPERFPFSASYSIGDVFIGAGALVLVFQGVSRGRQDALTGRGKAKGRGMGGFTGMSEEGTNVI